MVGTRCGKTRMQQQIYHASALAGKLLDPGRNEDMVWDTRLRYRTGKTRDATGICPDCPDYRPDYFRAMVTYPLWQTLVEGRVPRSDRVISRPISS